MPKQQFKIRVVVEETVTRTVEIEIDADAHTEGQAEFVACDIAEQIIASARKKAIKWTPPLTTYNSWPKT